MITWTKMSEDNWVLNSNGKTRRCESQRELILCSLVLDIHVDEIHFALLSLLNNKHNYCQFGALSKSFIFSQELKHDEIYC